MSYEEQAHRTYKMTEEGERILLANFTARIIKETRIFDGITTQTILTINGHGANNDDPKKPAELPPIEIEAQQFAGMSWVLNAWGVRAIIQPGTGVKDDLRTCIQQLSKPEIKTIYKAIGWAIINGEKAYLHAGGAITAQGNDPTVTTRLPIELSKYDLTGEADAKAAFRASLELTTLGPPQVAWVMWSATYAPLFGPVDFAIHLSGRSGTFKSELVSLFQSHYGSGMDARHLPGSWSSTPNALEAQAFHAANAVFVIDDFVPIGTAWQVRAYQTSADKIIRAQGNQAGRARLTDTSGLQTTFYPRGIILSTGEDTPEGHSVRARMMICELSPGDIDPKNLTIAQNNRKLYPVAVTALIKSLCKKCPDLTDKVNAIRNELIQVGHTRTPPMIGRLIATAEAVLNWAHHLKLIDETEKKICIQHMKEAIIGAGKEQHKYLESADPVEVFFAGLRQALAAGQGHIRTLHGGIPLNATTIGWTEERSTGDLPTYKSHGPCIGWVQWDDDELYLDINVGYATIKKVLNQEMTLTKQTLFKRLKDAGCLVRVDEARQRNTVRVTAESHPRQVLAISASAALEQQEKPSDNGEMPD
jgi:hypothetical protein